MTNESRRWEFVARALMAAIFLVAGCRKILGYAGTLGYFGSFGIPLPDLVLPLTIVLEVGGGIALMAGWRLRWVAIALGVFSLASGIIAHAFWSAPPAQFSGQLNNFLKNVAMSGGFLLVYLNARADDDAVDLLPSSGRLLRTKS